MTTVKDVLTTAGGCLMMLLTWAVGLFFTGLFMIFSVGFCLFVMQLCCGGGQ